ncbi:MAG: hypothetical protein ABS79_04905 [Planctomycetes bacterium SCN 63-9]|nr:MAG: hypothetical protein ABS79_04905 [Planctomycetes bacterium SCN 63-9]
MNLGLLAGSSPARADELQILPPTLRLSGPNARQRCLVELHDGKTSIADLTSKAAFKVENPAIARVSLDGIVTPVANGLTNLTARVGDRSVTIPISVENADRPGTWSFRNHVEAILTKQGCNSGACHGAAAGKNGFRLTLRAYGPEVDYDVITRQARGRRIVRTAPAESLLLLKPTGAIEHGGGIKFAPDSFDYRVLADWIAEGSKPPTDHDPQLRSLKIFPEIVKLGVGDAQRIIVQALYSDGRVEDVTHWAKYSSSDDTLARVDDSGQIKVEGTGEGAIAVLFGTLVGRVTVTVPSPEKPDPKVFASAPRKNPIDEKGLAKLESLGIPPSPDAGDAAFLRRAYLDATGMLPPAREVDAFLKDGDPDKRDKLVDRLLESREYVDYWTYKWSELLLVSSRKLPPPAMWSFYRFIRQSVEENRGWDRFARDVITSKGSTLSQGASNFFVLHRDPIDLAETSSMAFLGLSLTCARCHNHPLEKWTQDQYYGFASLFSRVNLKDGPTPGDVVVTVASDGEILHPRKGVAMAPQPLDGAAADPVSRRDRREVFADWLVNPENPYFAKAIVNRVWSNFFGRGLIHPEDDLRETNPPSDGPLLDWLIADFIAHKYDVKHLIRTIMTSATYARSSTPLKANQSDTKFLSHYPVKRLSAEVLLDTISQVTEVSSSFANYPAGWRSLQLPDSKVDSGFLDSFGRPARENTCSCERSSEPSMTQALHLANGTTVNEKLRSDKSAVAKAIAGKIDDATIVDGLFHAALSRSPSTAERQRMVEALATASRGIADAKAAATARRQAIEDLYWAVLTSNEFLFNH